MAALTLHEVSILKHGPHLFLLLFVVVAAVVSDVVDVVAIVVDAVVAAVVFDVVAVITAVIAAVVVAGILKNEDYSSQSACFVVLSAWLIGCSFVWLVS